MASIASVDKSLARASSWMSYAAFLGVVALAYLPMRTPVQPPVAAAVKAKAVGVTPSQSATPPVATAEKPNAMGQEPKVTGGEATVADSPAAAVPDPDVWTAQELAAGLRSCVRLLAPAAADIVLEEPMKRGQCGTPAPLVLHSIGEVQKVEFSPAPTMNCKLAASLADWVEKVLQPAAQQALGSRIKRIVGTSSYSCRNIYNNPKLTLSEHATGNAIDIAGFVTADGRTIMVAKGWGPTERDIVAAKKKAAEKLAAQQAGKTASEGNKTKGAVAAEAGAAGAVKTPSIEDTAKKASAKAKAKVVKVDYKAEEGKSAAEKPTGAAHSGELSPLAASNTKEAAFLKRLHGGSCTLFATVLGPEANEAHRDHFHLDMKVRQSGATVCH